MNLRCKLCIALSVLLLLPVESVSGFTDVSSDTWYYETVQEMKDKGFLDTILSQEELFEPEKWINRGEFVSLVMNVCQPGKTGTLEMADSEEIKEELKPFLGGAQEIGIFAGDKDENGNLYAKAEERITRQDAAVMLAKLLHLESEETADFVDSDKIAPYAQQAVSALQNASILFGMEDGSFEPDRGITRAEALQLVENVQAYSSITQTQNTEGVLSTYAGTGVFGNLDGIDKKSMFACPQGITGGLNGELYIMDTDNNIIRQVNDHKVVTAAGMVIGRDIYGAAVGMSSDGAAEKAVFSKPSYGIMNSRGELFISDSENNQIRVLRKNKVYTFCGNGKAGYRNGSSKETAFNMPGQIALDKEGNLYVADTLNHCIRKITPDGVSSLLAGTPEKGGFVDGKAGEAKFLEPVGIAVNQKTGVVYVADTGNQRIRKIQNGEVTTVAGSGRGCYYDTEYSGTGNKDGTCLEAEFAFPMGLNILPNENILIADSENHAIRMMTEGDRVVTIAGNTEAGYADGSAVALAMLNTPTDVYYQNGKIYIADSMNNVIRAMDFEIGEFN